MPSRQAPDHARGAYYGDDPRRRFTVDRLIRRMAYLGDRGPLEPVAVPTG